MNEHELNEGLGALLQERTRLADVTPVRQQILATPIEQMPQQRRWLPQVPKWRFQSMFSATKFVVAGVIVALFGGFLLTGVLTQPSDDRLPVVGASASATPQAEPTEAATSEPEPTPAEQPAADNGSATTSDLLPGVDLITAEVEPGVYRVLSDGVRDLATQVHDVTVTPEGDVWLEIAEWEWWSLVRLGKPGVSERFRWDPRELGLTSQGTPAVDGGRVFDGTGWPITGLSAYDECVLASRHGAVAADGSCWEGRGGNTLVRIEPDGSRSRVTGAELGLEPEQDHLGSPVTARDGTVWANVGRTTDRGGFFDGLLKYDGSKWSFIPYDGDEAENWDYRLAVGLDGVVWHGRALGSDRFYSYLAWDGDAWTDHGPAPDTAPHSLIGSTASSIAPNGSVWTVIDERLHVITPESVAAAE